MTKSRRTAVVFGKGRVAVRATELLLEESYDLQCVVPSSVELPGDVSFSAWAVARGLEVRRAERIDDLTLAPADLGLSTYYDRIFRQHHIELFGMLLNLHNSALPRYRGVRPINWALKNGETHHGVSLHQITPGIDEGPILAQRSFAIDPDVDEVEDVYWRCLAGAEDLLAESLPRIWDLVALPQDETVASYYSSADDPGLGDRRYWTRAHTRLE